MTLEYGRFRSHCKDQTSHHPIPETAPMYVQLGPGGDLIDITHVAYRYEADGVAAIVFTAGPEYRPAQEHCPYCSGENFPGHNCKGPFPILAVCPQCGREKGCNADCEDMNCDHCYCNREGRDG